MGIWCALFQLMHGSVFAESKFIKKVPWAEQGQWIKADTHIHSKLSDGQHSISEIASKAVEHGCDVIAITDHSDRELKGASLEYEREIIAARRTFPNLIILSGIEWNIPPWKGDQHVSLLLSPSSDEFNILREFKHRFDDFEREERVPDLVNQALNWLHETTSQSESVPVLFLNHPSRKLSQTDSIKEMFETWRATNDLIVGIEGGPGHQKGEPIGSYKGTLKPIDRWDPAVAEAGNAWDQLLSQGQDVWGAIATSDFHTPNYDYWPGEFSETWLYVPEKSADGAIAAFRAGSFFATHGHVVRKASLSISATGLGRAAYPGEVISVPEGETVLVTLECEIPDTDWSGGRNFLDELSIVTIQDKETNQLKENRIFLKTATFERGVSVPPEGLIVRGHGFSSKPGGENLFFYTNPIRIEANSSWLDSKQTGFPTGALKWIAGGFVFVGLLFIWIRRKLDSKLNTPHRRRGPPQAEASKPLHRKSGTIPDGATDWAPPEKAYKVQPIAPKNELDQHSRAKRPPNNVTQDQLVNIDQPEMWWEKYRLAQYVKLAYTPLVILVAGVYAYVMLTQGAISGVYGIPETWRPPGIFMVPALAAILVLLIIPRSPFIGLLSFLVINFVFPRYSPEDAYLFWLRMPEAICFLIFWGTLFSREFSSRYQTLPKSNIYLIFIAFLGWAILSSVVAELRTAIPIDERHHPLRLLNLFVLVTLSAIMTWDVNRFLIFAATCGISLTVRGYYFPESVYLDGDLGYLLAGVIPLVVAAFSTSKERQLKIIFAILSGLLLLTFYKSQNRACAVGLLFSILTAWLFTPNKFSRLLTALPVLVVCGVTVANGHFAKRFRELIEHGIHSGSAGARIEIWSTIPKVLDGNWLFGVGAGRFASLVGDVDPTHSEDVVHNIFLGVLSDNGIPGLLLYFSFFASVMSWYVVNRIQLRSYPARGMLIGVLSGVVGLIVAGQFMTRHDSPLQFCLIGAVISWSNSPKLWNRNLNQRVPAGPTSSSSDTAHTQALSPQSSEGHYALVLLFTLFLSFAVYGSIVPLNYVPVPFDVAVERYSGVLETPLDFSSRTDWTTNILLFVPIGYFGLGAVSLDQRKRALSFAPIVALNCVVFSLLIEFSQLWFPSRTPSLNDIVAESIGGGIGVLLWLSTGQSVVSYFRTLIGLRSKEDRITRLLSGYFVALLIYSLFPFDLTLRPAEIFDKFQDGRIEFVPFTSLSRSAETRLYSLFVETILFVPLGVLFERVCRSKGFPQIPLVQLSFYAFCLCFALESLQVLVSSRFSSVTDVATGTFGILAGAMVQRTRVKNQNNIGVVPKQSFRILACICYAIALCMLFWFPYNFSHDSALIQSRAEAFFSVPFSRLLEGNYLQSLWSIVRKILWFAPLGFLANRAIPTLQIQAQQKKAFTSAGILFLICFVFVVECVQIFLPDHSADFWDFLICSGGALSGWAIASFVTGRSGSHQYHLLDTGNTDLGDGHQSPSIRERFGRVPGADGLRAVACLAVFGVHFQQITSLEGKVGPFEVSRFLLNGNTGVCILFMLSGFFLSLPLWRTPARVAVHVTLKGYFIKRACRILPAYYVCLLILGVIRNSLLNQFDLSSVVWHGLLLHNFNAGEFYNISPPFWTVGIQVQLYFCFYILVAGIGTLRAWPRQNWAFVFLTSTIVSSLFNHYLLESVAQKNMTSIDNLGPVLTHSVLAHLPIFFLGCLTAYFFTLLKESQSRKLTENTSIWPDIFVVTATLFIVAIIGTPLDHRFEISGGRYNWPYIPILISLLIIFSLQGKRSLQFLEIPPFRRLGEISYGFYLFHLPCLSFLNWLLGKFTLPEALHIPSLFIGGILLTVFVSETSSRFIETPFLNLCRSPSRYKQAC